MGDPNCISCIPRRAVIWLGRLILSSEQVFEDYWHVLLGQPLGLHDARPCSEAFHATLSPL
jgi:hypothetical protein